MKKLLLFFSTFILTASYSQNTISVSATGNFADYDNLGDAIDAANSGDIIHVYGGDYTSTNDTINKQLTIIGPGYFLNQNPETQIFPNKATFSWLAFMPGSSGSSISGIFISTFFVNSVSNISIQNNNVNSMDIVNSSNIIFSKNYFRNNFIEVLNSTNVLISNNLFPITQNFYEKIEADENSTLTIINNIINDNIIVQNSIIKNNIFYHSFFSDINILSNVIENNVFVDDISSMPISNIVNVNEDSLFVGYPTQSTYSDDGRFQLKPNSLAIGAGENGEDCGAFGGSTPYRLSGTPSVPNIHFLQAPTVSSSGSGLPIQIKVNAND